MRLIDADALKEKKVYSHERHEKVVPVAEIDWMPTIDAIPVEWLKQKRDSRSDPWDYLANAIYYILAVYKKEQEAQDG